MEDSLSLIADAVEVRIGLPRPNWSAIACWVESNVEPVSLNDAWTGIARDWLGRLSRALPPGYAVHESSEFMLLAADAGLAERVLNWCERSRRMILDNLIDVAVDEGFGKHVALVFEDAESYYDYVADFYPDEGEFALSGGMFLNVGYGHFVICPACGNDHERTIAHELTHTLLRHLPLPLWLNEGVAQFMEDVILGASHFMVDHEAAFCHRSYWNEEAIQMFWSGDAFFCPDDGQELSYQLSQVLFRNLISDYPKKVCEILKNAHYTDAGNAAFVDVCGVTLADRVTQFLGSGKWTPRCDNTVAELEDSRGG